MIEKESQLKNIGFAGVLTVNNKYDDYCGCSHGWQSSGSAQAPSPLPCEYDTMFSYAGKLGFLMLIVIVCRRTTTR